MEILSRVVEKFPLWNAGVFLSFVAVCIWLLTRLDEETRRHVELSRHLWEATSTYEGEFQKVRLRGRLFLLFCVLLNLIWAIVIVCAYALAP
jgi:hypothetical protein